jgi:hypothetical protein
VCDIDQHIQDHKGRGHGSADNQDPAHVANNVAIFLCRAGRQKALPTGATGPRYLSGSAALPRPRSTAFGGAILGNDLRLEFRSSRFLGRGERSRRTRRGSRLRSSGMPLARTVRSTSALGHVL